MKVKIPMTDDELLRRMQESFASPRRIAVTSEYLEERMRRYAEWEKNNKE